MRTYLTYLLLFPILWSSLSSVAEGQNKDLCTLPPEEGRCRARKPKFYFNSATNRCEIFFYGGCGGNENRFETLIDCQDACFPDQEVRSLSSHFRSSHCTLGPIKNSNISCRAAFPMFTFNSLTGTCDNYLYGGCGATQNLYSSSDECLSACLHGSHVSISPQARGSLTRSRLAPATPPPQDEQNDITFPGFDSDDICQLPPVEPGIIACLAYMEKWTFDPKQQKCVQFIYGGCRGTENLFDSESDCQKRCQIQPNVRVVQDTPDFCSDPPTSPPGGLSISCLAYFPKFTYDAELEECKSLIYGGCFGTQNLFDTERECYKTCNPAKVPKPKTLDVCSLPISSGPCRAHKLSYGFNGKTRRCELFRYGGCQGNDNRFSSIEECVNTCGGLEPQDNPICTTTTCEEGPEVRIYKAKACKPVIKPGECCPSSWDCSAWEERLRRRTECFIANDDFPNGKYFSPAVQMEEISKNCNVACFCGPAELDSVAKPICATVDCFNPEPEGQNCERVHNTIDGCCDASYVCDDQLEALPTCLFENKTYVAGQKMYSEQNKCRVCMCKEGWTGEPSDEFCYNVDCFATAGHFLAMNCQPIFRDGVCCPVDWNCPDPELLPKPISVLEQVPVLCPDNSSPIKGPILVPEALEPLSTAASGEKNEIPLIEGDVCLLPRAEGECEPFTDKWYFNHQKRTCQMFKYGSFITNGRNVFDTEMECKSTCKDYILGASAVSKNNSQRCEDASEDGFSLSTRVDRCRPRNSFRFNKQTRKCEDFVYLGCSRNSNSFATIDECEATCSEEMSSANKYPGMSPKCSQEVQVGPCRSRLQRYYYDPSSGICKQFWFSGCGGNQNNFEDLRDCIDQCVPVSRIPRALRGQVLEVKSACEQDKKVGPCRGAKPSWYFEKETKTCRLFLYGGCQGNENRFDSFAQCSETCPVELDAQEKLAQACGLPKSQGGLCRARMNRYFYNSETNDCEAFIYSGCGGNSNNFANRAECLLSCKFANRASFADDNSGARVYAAQQSSEQDVCLLDKAIGMCRASFRKFYFDRDEKVCKEFIYGGCQGNGNNFGSLTECESTCSQHLNIQIQVRSSFGAQEEENVVAVDEPVCGQPMDSGPCKAARPFWFYNSTSGMCERFYWGGCKGNLNRFKSLDDCTATCGNSRTPRQGPLISLPLPSPKCSQAGKNFNLGDTIRFNEDKCRVCTCNSPPDLTCMVKDCPNIPPRPPGRCFPRMDPEGCCIIGYRCVSIAPPVAIDKNSCAHKQCRAIRLIRVKEGEVCTKRYSQDGCCLIGQKCELQACTTKKCQPIRLNPPRPGEICTKTYDDEQCCVIGQVCTPQDCKSKLCPAISVLPPKKGEVCSPVLDNDGCCVVGRTCKPEICATKMCRQVKLVPGKPDETCFPLKDSDGCCVIGQRCVKKACLTKPCPLIGFLPPPGQTCEEEFDADGCCTIGLKNCVDT